MPPQAGSLERRKDHFEIVGSAIEPGNQEPRPSSRSTATRRTAKTASRDVFTALDNRQRP
jgi:hypothetical protein